MTTDEIRQRAAAFDKLADNVQLLNDDGWDQVLRQFHTAPTLLDEERPTDDAWYLAYSLAETALSALAQKLPHGLTLYLDCGPVRTAPLNDWRSNPDAASFGLALVGATSPEARYVAGRLRGFASLGAHNEQERRKLLRRASEFLIFEETMWNLAGQAIPYAYRYAALSWFWDPAVHEGHNAPTLCLRCGRLLYRKGRKTRAAPRCPKCAKDSPEARVWPEHAIAPAGHATWWLHCGHEGCTPPFEGPRNAKWCPQHKPSRMTASKRPAHAPAG